MGVILYSHGTIILEHDKEGMASPPSISFDILFIENQAYCELVSLYFIMLGPLVATPASTMTAVATMAAAVTTAAATLKTLATSETKVAAATACISKNESCGNSGSSNNDSNSANSQKSTPATTMTVAVTKVSATKPAAIRTVASTMKAAVKQQQQKHKKQRQQKQQQNSHQVTFSIGSGFMVGTRKQSKQRYRNKTVTKRKHFCLFLHTNLGKCSLSEIWYKESDHF